MQTHGYKVEEARLEFNPLDPESCLAPLLHHSILLCVPARLTREEESGEEKPLLRASLKEKLRNH